MSSSLEKQAAERKAKLEQLKNLKRKREVSSQSEGQATEESSTINETVLKSRNFDPELRGAKLGFESGPIEISATETVEFVADELQEAALKSLAQQTSENTSLTISNLQPKKVNWDLKRDLEPSLQILETRTNNAIIKAVRERVRAAAVSTATTSSSEA